MDITGFGGLAYQIIVDRIQKNADAAGERDQTRRYLRAITFELRVTINLLDLALRAEQAGDAIGRNNILNQIECPILSAVAMGLSGVPLGEKGIQLLLEGISSPETETGEDCEGTEKSDLQERDVIDQTSLVVSRLYTTLALARAGSLQMDIRWEGRCRRIRNDLLTLHKRLLEDSTQDQ